MQHGYPGRRKLRRKLLFELVEFKMTGMKRLVQFIPVLMLLLSANEALAQAHQVNFTPITDLSFGTVTAGTSSNITVSSSGVAEFQVVFVNNARNNAQITLTFALPSSLTSGTNSLPITFGANSAAYNTTNSLSGSTSFDPSQGISNFVARRSSLTLYVWIGGSINPPTGQAAGNYTGAITVNGTCGHRSNSVLVNATASIIQGLSLTATGSLDFYQIIAGTTPPSLSAQANGSAPEFTATGNGGQQVWVTYSSSTLYNGANTLTFLPSVYGGPTMTQAASSPVSSGSSIYLSGTTGSQGDYYFWLGGSLGAIPAGQVPGNYAGTFTLTVSY